MQHAKRSIDYWLNWTPGNREVSENGTDRTDRTDKTPPKTTSVSSVSCQLGPVLVERTNGQDPQLWSEEFATWAAEACVWQDRCFCGLSGLFVTYCEWSLKGNLIGCMRGTFEVLLERSGFEVVDGLVHGLVSKDELVGMAAEYPVLKRSEGK